MFFYALVCIQVMFASVVITWLICPSNIVATNASIGSEPNVSTIIRYHASHRIAAEAFCSGKVGQRFSVVPANAVGIGAEPEVSVFILKYATYIFADLSV
jgi:hypothetical protein